MTPATSTLNLHESFRLQNKYKKRSREGEEQLHSLSNLCSKGCNTDTIPSRLLPVSSAGCASQRYSRPTCTNKPPTSRTRRWQWPSSLFFFLSFFFSLVNDKRLLLALLVTADTWPLGPTYRASRCRRCDRRWLGSRVCGVEDLSTARPTCFVWHPARTDSSQGREWAGKCFKIFF